MMIFASIRVFGFLYFNLDIFTMLAFQSNPAASNSCFVLHAPLLLAQGPEAQLGTRAAALQRLFG